MRLLAVILNLFMLSAMLAAAEANAQSGVSAARTEAQQSFFGSVELKRTSLKPFPKWTGALERHFDERTRAAGSCTAQRYNPCHYREWQDFINANRGKPLAEQLAAVNGFMNRRPYIIDMINWGVDDYWATPNEFFQKDGDCEDYAIAKFLTLRSLGRNDLDLRVAVVQDMNLRVAHAVLVVRSGGKTMVLDNQIKQVVEAQSIRHYRPIYSVSEDAWWLHRQP